MLAFQQALFYLMRYYYPIASHRIASHRIDPRYLVIHIFSLYFYAFSYFQCLNQ